MSLDYYYGPTSWSDQPGMAWHRDCPDTEGRGRDGWVVFFKEGPICDGCGEGEDWPTEEGTTDA